MTGCGTRRVRLRSVGGRRERYTDASVGRGRRASMITRQTLLVLGAGASAPYGFPTGRQLLVEICDNLLVARQSELRTGLLNCGFSTGELDEFRKRLRRSQQPSVDAFLEVAPKFERLGKAAIVLSLIRCEKEGALYRGSELKWYEYLFGLMLAEKADFSRNKLSVITFNCDRSFEHSLFMAIQHTYGVCENVAAAMLRSVEIIHVYGQLGSLPYLGGPAARAYTPEVDYDFVMNCCIDQIHIMRRGGALTSQFQDADRLAHDAKEVHFLGFAYHKMNVERLGVDRWRVRAYGSAHNLMNAERQRAKQLFPCGLMLREGHMKTLEYVRTWVVFEDL
jgi:hypothetical protein